MDKELLDRLAVRQLVENWAIWRDAGDWDRFRTLWHDDGRMMATWTQGTADEFIEMSNPNDAAQPWDIEAARTLYNIHRWGAKYFDINDAGHVVARPLQDAGASVDLTDVIEEAKGRGLKFPLLIRFQDILRHRVEAINKAFQSSIAEFNFQGKYRGVFPIKVNQLREVVEEIIDAGEAYQFGLEAGSKGELIAVLAMNGPESLTIVNGYKDESMMRLALIGLKLGKRVYLIHKLRKLAARKEVADLAG